jgi:hypothetical protein
MGDLPLMLLIIVLTHQILAGCAKVAGLKVAKEPNVGWQSLNFCDSIWRLQNISRR